MHSRYFIFFVFLHIMITGGVSAQLFTRSNLPIVLINTSGQAIPNDVKIDATLKIIDNGEGQINHVTDPPTWYNGRIGIEVRGASSSGYPQKPYAFETRDIAGEDSSVVLFGWPDESDYVLLSHYGDKSLVRNELSFKLFSESGNYASRFQWVEVLLNGEYDGIYLFGEKIKRDNGRVDIAKLEPADTAGNALTGGYIYKVDYWNWDDSWVSPNHPIGFPWYDIHYVYYYPKPAEIVPEQKEYISSYVTAFEDALYGPGFTDPETGYPAYIDIPSFIDYFLVNEVSRNNDGFKKSYYFHKDRDDNNPLIKSGPVWDFDWAWKNIAECSIFAATDGSGWAYNVNNCGPDVNSPGYYVRLFQDPAFANAVKCRWQELRSDVLNTDSICAWIDGRAVYLWEAQQRHFIRFPIAGNYAVPEVPPIPQTYAGELEKLKAWITLRMNWLEMSMPGVCYTGFSHIQPQKITPLVFPQPADEHLWIESSAFEPGDEIRIFDPAGRELKLSPSFDRLTFIFNVSGLPGSIYFYKVFRNSVLIVTGKIMVSH